MALKLGRFLKVEFQGFNSNVGRENHISAMFLKNSQKATDVMVLLLALHRGKSLESELANYPVRYFDDDSELVYDVMGTNRRNIALVEAKREDGSTKVNANDSNVGVNGAPFYLVFNEEWFNYGETLYGNLNEEYPMRIIAQPYMLGTLVVYTVSLMGCPQGIPANRLLAGELFSHSAAYVSREYSRMKGGLSIRLRLSLKLPKQLIAA